MQLDATGRVATVYVDQKLAQECGGTYEDTEGLINLPLTVKEIQAVVFFKEDGPGDWRVSMRSKGDDRRQRRSPRSSAAADTRTPRAAVRRDVRRAARAVPAEADGRYRQAGSS